MATTDSHSSASTSLFRIVAVLVLFLSIAASGLQVVAALNSIDHPDPNVPVPVPTLFIPAILSLIGGIALSTLLAGIAQLINTQPVEQPGKSESPFELIATMTELQNTLPALIAEAVQQSVAQIPAATESAPTTNPDNNLHEHLQRMVKLLEEMKELSMLDEPQRQTRRQQVLLRRKNSRLEEVTGLIQQENWAQADALLHLLESLYPGDSEVLTLRNRLDDARIFNQTNAWENLTQQVNDLLALSQYSQAAQNIEQFLERFPTHTQAQQLLERVREEETIYRENAAGRLYDQIKLSVENRQWRVALVGIQQFLEKHPEHPRAEKIRKQIRVIQKNAEIEDRHEQEDRIKGLISAQRFGEAADLCEDLLSRFPDSPQAAYLTDLLPKLREKSAETESAATP